MVVDVLPVFPHLVLETLDQDPATLRLVLRSTRQVASCPNCGQESVATYGWFTRQLHTLPCLGQSVQLRIHAHRFRCANPLCQRRTFREHLTDIAQRSQRRTQELTAVLQQIAVELGGRAGERLARHLHLHVSATTLLRLVKRTADQPFTPPRLIGVDEFAWKKGQRYGTLIVDHEVHRVLAILPDREVATVAAWLRNHPSILMVTRDRSGAFAEAIRQGAPQALQVADRFHLVMNATKTLEALFTRDYAALQATTRTLRATARAALSPTAPPVYSHQRQSEHRRTRRHATYERVVELDQHGWSRSAIARELDLHRDTVARYLNAGQFPERLPRTPRPKAVAKYHEYLQQRWEEGEHTIRILLEELRERGYRGGFTMLAAFLRPWRKQREDGIQEAAVGKRYPWYPPRKAMWLVLKPERQRTPEEHAFVTHLLQQSPPIAQAVSLVQHFCQLVRERDVEALGPWTQAAESSGVKEVVRFAQGLYRDWEAVENALLFHPSQGQTEGQVHRLKLIRRQSYGRAGPALLQGRLQKASRLNRKCL